MEINGIAHIHITVNDLTNAIPFYEKVLGFMGFIPVVKATRGIYLVGGKTAVAITRSSENNRQDCFDQTRIGLHHICFRAKKREDVDELHEYLKSIQVKIVYPPQEGPWVPGYYSILFEDPDGIRLEVNYVPTQSFFIPPKGQDGHELELPLTYFPGYEDYPEM